jgi:hypothetical protein
MDSTNPTAEDSFSPIINTMSAFAFKELKPLGDVQSLRSCKKLPPPPPKEPEVLPPKAIITHCLLCNVTFENFPAHNDYCRVQMLECFCALVHNKCWKQHCYEFTEFNQKPVPDVVCGECGAVVRSCKVLNGKWYDGDGNLVHGCKEERFTLRRARALRNFKE